MIDMRGETFISLSILNQILSAEFFIEIFLTFLTMNIDINWVNLTPCQAH